MPRPIRHTHFSACALSPALVLLFPGCARPPTIDLRPADVAGIRAAIATHRGDVVLVDFWATWCVPCVQELPHLIEWHERYAAKGLAIITVSLDLPEQRADVVTFLRNKKVPFETLWADVPDHTTLVEATSPRWGGEVPAVFLYDRTGTLRHELLGENHADADIEAKFLPLLAATTHE